MRVMVADRGTGEPISLGAALLTGKKVAPDAANLLIEDHRTVLGWFKWYEQAKSKKIKADVARNVCKALRAHMAAEEEIYYPAVKLRTGDDDVVQRAVEEHRRAKRLLEQIESSKTADPAQAQLMRELRAEIEAHVAEEESTLIPEARDTDMNPYAVGRGVAARRVDELFEQSAAARNSRRKTTGRGKSAKASAENRPPKEFPVMQISPDEARDYYVLGLKNAHAAVKEGQTMVKAQAERLEQYPKLKQKLESHLKEKKAQLKRLETLLESCGERPSAVKDTAMQWVASLGNLSSAAADDEVIKNSLATLGLAKFEAASFETLILFGEAAGERDALRPLQECLSEERAMAAFIEENLRATGMRFLQLKSEGAQASH
jgi:ferritin-like metal-binding protein YciE/hemerythrin superfamily protein